MINRSRMRYSQMDSKSADFNDINFSRSGQFNNWVIQGGNMMTASRNFDDRGFDMNYPRKNSAEGEQMYNQPPPPSAFERSKVTANAQEPQVRNRFTLGSTED